MLLNSNKNLNKKILTNLNIKLLNKTSYFKKIRTILNINHDKTLNKINKKIKTIKNTKKKFKNYKIHNKKLNSKIITQKIKNINTLINKNKKIKKNK